MHAYGFLMLDLWRLERGGGKKAVFRSVNNFEWVILGRPCDNILSTMISEFWQSKMEMIREMTMECIEDLNLRDVLLQRHDWLMKNSYMKQLLEKCQNEFSDLSFATIGMLDEIQRLNSEELELILPAESIFYDTINDALSFFSEYPYMMKDYIESLYANQTEDEITDVEIGTVYNQLFPECILRENVETRLSDAQPLLF